MSSAKDEKKGGSITVYIGPMFSGKTSSMLTRVGRHRIAGKKCLLIKFNDGRYQTPLQLSGEEPETIVSHDKTSVEAFSVQKLSDAADSCADIDCIGIDEGQFFPDLVFFCESMASQGKIVVVAALDATYQREAFENTIRLIPKAESVFKLRAVCVGCKKENASFSRRITAEDGSVVIGGADKYAAVCRSCFRNFM